MSLQANLNKAAPVPRLCNAGFPILDWRIDPSKSARLVYAARRHCKGLTRASPDLWMAFIYYYKA